GPRPLDRGVSRARHPWFYTLPVALTLAGPRAVPARPIAPVAVPGFAVLAGLLRERQGIDLGGPAGDDHGSASVPHFQQFGTGEGGPLAAFEEHADGTIYLAFLPPVGPEWYDVGRADDTEESRDRVIPVGRGRRRFADAQQRNVRLDHWESPNSAFPAGRAPVPRWPAFPLPLVDSCAARPSGKPSCPTAARSTIARRTVSVAAIRTDRSTRRAITPCRGTSSSTSRRPTSPARSASSAGTATPAVRTSRTDPSPGSSRRRTAS